MIRTPEQALTIANGTRVNVEGMCQQVTRGYYNGPSAGDRDRDGDADAYDGWLSEPKEARHPGDRHPPAGYPVAFRGGSKGHGHRAISLGGGRIRSTDFDGLTKRYRAGVLGNGTIGEVERAMGVTYLGWSETIDGQPIPKGAAPEKPKPPAKRKEPVSHTRTVNAWTLSRNVDTDDLSATRQSGKQPYADAAAVAKGKVDAAMLEYFAATERKKK